MTQRRLDGASVSVPLRSECAVPLGELAPAAWLGPTAGGVSVQPAKHQCDIEPRLTSKVSHGPAEETLRMSQPLLQGRVVDHEQRGRGFKAPRC